jgi:hypothetical protein
MYSHPSANYPAKPPPLQVKKNPCTNARRLLDRRCRECEDEVPEICNKIRAKHKVRRWSD